MKNIVLFGGAFDPIHNGHINMAEEASRQLDADVFFIPARISVWKSDSAPIEDKINMINLACQESALKSRFYISRYEADLKTDVNYSIDTVKHFKEQYQDANLFLLIGTDQVNSFHKWKDADEIASLAQIVYFARPDLELNEQSIKRFNMRKIEGQMVDASSTDIRELKSWATPGSVLNYCATHNLYFVNKIKEYMGEHRFNHTISVTNLSYEIAKANNFKDSNKVVVAALLHDIGKELPIEEQKQIMVEHFPDYLDLPPVIYHQFVSAYIASRKLGITDIDILDAIRYHTTANSDLSDVAKIVYCADKIEPTRNFDSTELINAMKSSINDGFVTVLKANVEYYEQKGIDYKNKLQMACIDQYLK